MKKIIINIGGMSCSACSNSLEKYLNKQEKIKNASVNLVLAQALIEYDDDLTYDDLKSFIEAAGFEALGIYNGKEENENKKDKYLLIVFTILALLVLYIAMGSMIHLPAIPFLDMMARPLAYTTTLMILAIMFIIYGIDISKSGIKNLKHLSPNMDSLVTIGVSASFIYSLVNTILIWQGNTSLVHNLYFESCAIVIYFIKLGRFIDKKSKEKTKSAIKELVQITPTMALLKTKDGEKEVTIDEIKKGDILIAKPGMRIAVDGIITKGSTHLNESFITGESKPNKKKKDDTVIAGSTNIDGVIEYKAEKIGKNSTISEIVRLVVEATNTKAPIARIADKVSNYFVPAIIVIACIVLFDHLLVGYALADAIKTFVTILVVACPCALGLATPLAIVVSIGSCAKQGILVKSSETLENAHKIDTIVFDKTGTLTYGNLKISKINNYTKANVNTLISKVASLENSSTHPIANAFKEYALDKKIDLLPVKDFKNLNGLGLQGKIKNKQIYVGNRKLVTKLKIKNDYLLDEEKLVSDGNSIVYVIEENKIIGLIGVQDTIRTDAKKTINALLKMNKDIIMLTGDNEKTASLIGSKIGITNIKANVSPKEKNKIIKDLIKDGHKVMMVGDGINDAPSIAEATIGLSFKKATDIAADTADVILMHDDLEKIITLFNISKKTILNIKENLFWAFFYNVCMIPIAIGLFRPWKIEMNPMIASLAMMLSSFTVVLNALRLKKGGEK